MRLRDLLLKFKAVRLKRLVLGINGGKRRRRRRRRRRRIEGNSTGKKASWMNPVSHGHHVIEHRRFDDDDDDHHGCDSVVVQREQMGNTELWYFGIFDTLIGQGVTKYMQSHFLEKQLKECDISRKCKETLKRAYGIGRSKMRDGEDSEERIIGSASAMVINGQKLVIAHIGHYSAVLCRDGIAYHFPKPPHWTRKLLSGMVACESDRGGSRYRSSELVVTTERIDPDTEFLILASNGIWEVMKNQEAVNLIRHIENPQEAAECLAKEALIRMTKSNISCIIIRFD